MILFATLAAACSGSSSGGGGSAGSGGDGGASGSGGNGGSPECEDAEDCEDTECKTDGVCDPSDGVCDFTIAEDGTVCGEGECLDGVCAPVGAFSCTDQGIREAIAEGGGPHFFACDGPTTVVIKAVLMIDNDVILDGEGQLTVDGGDTHPMLEVAAERTVELRGFELANSLAYSASDIVNLGMLTLTRSRLFTSIVANDGTMTMADSTMAPRADWNISAAIANAGVLVVTNSSFSAAHIANPGVATVDGSTFSGTPTAPDALSGIYNRKSGTVTLTNTTVSGSESLGIENEGTMTIENSTISGNAGGNYGGGILNTGALSVTNSTVSGNTATTGGGIYNLQGATLTLTSTTVSGNTGNDGGGGIFNGGVLTLINSTVSGNSASSGAGILESFGGTMSLMNSLIDGDCAASAVTSAGGNLESPGDTCGFDQPTDQVNVGADDLKLGPLQDNGGRTETHALLPGSPAIDAISADMCEVDEDQRGEPRPGGAMCDVGAFEVQP